jgi:predicted ATP-dependent endonuclease of OLD family
MAQKLIEKVEIEKFRHLEDIEFNTGEKLTWFLEATSWQNIHIFLV